MLPILLKGAGALCIVAVGGMAGRRKGAQAMRRVYVLEEMISVLTVLRNNVHFRRDRTYDVLCACLQAEQLRYLIVPVALLQDGPGLKASIGRMLARTRTAHAQELCAKEIDCFCEALSALGKCPAQQAEQALAYAAARLEEILQTARRQAEQQQKLCRTVGVSMGGVVALLLL